MMERTTTRADGRPYDGGVGWRQRSNAEMDAAAPTEPAAKALYDKLAPRYPTNWLDENSPEWRLMPEDHRPAAGFDGFEGCSCGHECDEYGYLRHITEILAG